MFKKRKELISMEKFIVGIEEIVLKKFEITAEDEYEAEEMTIKNYFKGAKPISQEITSRNAAVLEPEEGDWNQFYGEAEDCE